MKYTRSALGLLAAQYRSVLKKCLLFNLGLFAFFGVISAPASAATDIDTWSDLQTSLTTGNADVVITDNLTANTVISVDNQTNIADLNGKTISGTENIATGMHFRGGSLTFKNGGVISGLEYNGVLGLIELNGTALTMTDGDWTFENNISSWGALDITQNAAAVTADVSSLTFNNNNSGVQGGALRHTAVTDSSNYTSTFTADTITFSNNSVVATSFSGSGGAVLNAAGNLLLLGGNNTFDGNKMEATVAETRYYKVGGGAIANQSSSYLAANFTLGKDTESTNTFTGNSSVTNGGAIMNRAVDEDQDADFIINGTTTFENNSATINGGAIYNIAQNDHIANVTLNGISTFSANTAENGGAIYNTGTLTLADAASFIDNSATSQGGAIYNEGELTISAVTQDASFSGNTANGAANDIYSLGAVNLNAAEGKNISLEGGIDGMDYDLKINQETTGTVLFGGNVNNAKTVEIAGGKVQNKAAMTTASWQNAGTFENTEGGSLEVTDGKIENLSGAVLTSDITKLLSDIHNEGTLNLFSASSVRATNTNNISGNGITNINGDTNLGTSKISGNAVNVIGGTLSVSSADNFDNTVSLTAQSGSTVDIADNTVTLKAAMFKSNSTLKLKIENADRYGSIVADTINVEKNAKLSAVLSQSAAAIGTPVTYQLLSSADSSFVDNFDYTFENNMFKFEKVGTSGQYRVITEKTAADVVKEYGGTKTNQAAAAAWVDGGDFSESATAQKIADDLIELAQTDGAGLKKNLTILAPNDAPVVQEVSVSQNNKLFNAVNTQLARTNEYGISSGDSGMYSLKGISVWATPYYGESKLQKRKEFYGFNTDSAGVVGGIEKQFTSHTKAGIGMQYDRTDVKGYNRKDDIDTWAGFVYAEYQPSKWFMNGIASYSHADYDEKKHTLGQTVKADYNAEIYGLQALTGYEVSYMTPQTGLRYYHIKRDGYTDSAAQSVGSKNLDILTGVLGVKMQSPCGQFRPEMYFGLTYDFISDRDNALVTLPNGSNYAVHGKRLNRMGAEFHAGLATDLTSNLTANIGYLGAYREDYQNHTGMLEMKYMF
ncbi:MAG: autotransporter domain-containing protein [Alphaproteobacteria bacterium]|nr:autotransporter domain-containing protein [Alphaproteobacteria bacterium]